MNAAGLRLTGCGINRLIDTKVGEYGIDLSVITAHLDLAFRWENPALSPFADVIAEALGKACRKAHRAMGRPPGSMKIKEAAYRVMEDAYHKVACDERTGRMLPAGARQIMYAARQQILELTGKDKLNDHYITQVLLPNYMAENRELTADWDVVYDDRGVFIEPDTGRVVTLGTLAVRQCLRERPSLDPPARLRASVLARQQGRPYLWKKKASAICWRRRKLPSGTILPQ